MKLNDAANNPGTLSSAYVQMLPRWNKMRTLLAGTEAMREAGATYLPKHPAESPAAYAERLQMTTLFNMTSLTLASWIGRPFSEQVKINEDVPPQIKSLLENNLDLQGNDINVFARRWFGKGLSKAFCHVLVEFPHVEKTEKPRTMADDRAENLNPYWVMIEPEDVIFAHATVIDGVETLDHVRIMEYDTSLVKFAETTVRKIRVLTPGHVDIYKEKPTTQINANPEWILDDAWDTALPFIPLVTFYADREAFMMGKSPLLDLADLNISHWQSSSDQRSILTVSRFPILACSGGVDVGKELVVGPNKWLYSPDADGKFYYVEHTGAAIEAGRQDLLDLEKQMSNYGAEFLNRKPGNPLTATARAMDAAESTSPLVDVTYRFLDAVATALLYTAQWLKLEDGGTISLPTDFGPEEAVTADYQALIAARKNQDISRAQFNLEMKRRGTYSEDFDEEENQAQLESEALDLAGSAVDTIIDPDAVE